MNTQILKAIALLLLLAGSFSCEEPEQSKSSEKKILSIEAEHLVEVSYSHQSGFILMNFEGINDVKSITPFITVSPGATISPASGVTQDFTSKSYKDLGVTYTVTAEDGSTVSYLIMAAYTPPGEEEAVLKSYTTEKENFIMTRASNNNTTVNLGAGTGGTTDPVPNIYPHDSTENFECKAIPNDLYRFDKWLVNNKNGGTNTEFNSIVPAGAVVTATFLDAFTVTVQSEDPGKGTVSGGGKGNSVSISATPAAGYEFEGWYKNGTKVSGLGANASYTPTETCTLTAKFELVIPPINGPSVLCTGSSGTFTINIPTGVTGYTWDKSSNLSLSGSGSSVSVSAAGPGAGWVRILINGTEVNRYNVWVGPPIGLRLTGPASGALAGGDLSFNILTSSTLESVNWSVSPNIGVRSISPSGNGCIISFNSASEYESYVVTATAGNSCGTSAVTYSFTMGRYAGDYAP